MKYAKTLLMAALVSFIPFGAHAIDLTIKPAQVGVPVSPAGTNLPKISESTSSVDTGVGTDLNITPGTVIPLGPKKFSKGELSDDDFIKLTKSALANSAFVKVTKVLGETAKASATASSSVGDLDATLAEVTLVDLKPATPVFDPSAIETITLPTPVTPATDTE